MSEDPMAWWIVTLLAVLLMNQGQRPAPTALQVCWGAGAVLAGLNALVRVLL